MGGFYCLGLTVAGVTSTAMRSVGPVRCDRERKRGRGRMRCCPRAKQSGASAVMSVIRRHQSPGNAPVTPDALRGGRSAVDAVLSCYAAAVQDPGIELMFRRSPAWMLPILVVLGLCGLIGWLTTDHRPAAAPRAPVSLPAPEIAPQPVASRLARPLPSRAVVASQLPPRVLARLSPIERHAHLLRLQPGSTLVLINEDNRLGVHHHRYEQNYRGVRIAQRNFVVNEYADGRPAWISGFAIQGLAGALPSVTPRISAAQAMDIGLRMAMDSGAGRPVIEDRRVEMRIYIADDHPRLAYIVTFDGNRPDSGETFAPVMVIDAANGALLEQWDDVIE